jgi:hypothetical protein
MAPFKKGCSMKKPFFFLLFFPFLLMSQVLVITHNFNRPDFIEMQYKTLQKFLKDDYEYVVFNDANDEQMKRQIQEMCGSYGIRCIPIPQELHSGYVGAHLRHATCVRYCLDLIGLDHDGVVFILDTDIVLVRPFSVEKYMADKDIAGRINRPRNKAFYVSPLFCMLNMSRLPDKRSLTFNCGDINGVPGDTGGSSYYYLLDHPELNVVPVRMTFSHQLFLADKHINKLVDEEVTDDAKRGFYEHFGFNNTEIAFLLKRPDTFEFYLDNLFLHYRGSSYTTGDDYKLQIFKEFVNEILR